MTVTFDNNQTLSDMVHFDGVSTYTYRDRTTGDFFDNNDAVGACLYFTWDRGVWHDLTVNVGTQLVAGAITLAWEYYHNVSGWIAIPGLVDNTNSFQNAGVNTVSFSPPDAWAYIANIGFSTNDGVMIRARITAVTSITEGGANQTTAVFGKDYAIQITADETLVSIKTANAAGGWGVVNNTADFYEIISNLRLTGNLVIQSQTLNVGTTANRRVIIKTSGILQLGYKDGSDNIYNGATLNYLNADITGMSPYNYWYGNLNMYNSLLWKKTGGFGDYGLNCVLDIESSALEDETSTIFMLGSGNIKNITFSTPANKVYLYTGSITMDNVIFGHTPGILAGSSNATVRNTNFGTDKTFAVGNGKIIYAIDCDFDDLATQFINTGTNCKIYNKYGLELNVLDENNNPITGYDVKLTNSHDDILNNGAWVNMDITTYLDESDSIGANTYNNYNPFVLEIKKSGFKTYKSKFTLANSNRKLTIALQTSILHNPSMGGGMI